MRWIGRRSDRSPQQRCLNRYFRHQLLLRVGMNRNLAFGSAILLAALFVGHTPVWGQNAVVSGRVTDTSGAVIPSVTVELTNRATQVKSSTVTNEEGIFVFPSVPPGAYEVNAGITGFNTSRIDSVTAGGRAIEDPQLHAHRRAMSTNR